MKKYNQFLICLLILIGASCEDKYTQEFIANSPIYMTYEELASSVEKVDARNLVNPGKMYFKDGYIFIVEEMEGIHIIDNTNPSNPINIGFIVMPGAVDIAIKGNILYTDSYVDLVSLDISDLSNITEVHREKKAFPYTLPPYDEEYPLADVDEEKGVVVGWEVKSVKQEVENYYYPIYYRGMEMDAMANFSGGKSISGNGFGISGSMARFGLYENALYIIDNSNLHIYKTNKPEAPEKYKEFYAGWTIETMFILNDKMFIGSQGGMFVYDISNALSPMYLSQFNHATACDPVVVKDNYAYITLRSGSTCWNNNVNELDVVSITDIENPELLERYPMTNPHGLGIDGNTLFLCDGDAGLKIYDITDPMDISNHQISVFPEIQAYDVIPFNNVLMLIGDDGFYQYDYSDLNNITFMSKIDIVLPEE